MGKWPTTRRKKDNFAHDTAQSQQKPYFSAALRAFLRDAALSEEVSSPAASLNGQIVGTHASKMNSPQAVPSRFSHMDATNSTCGHSLKMPFNLQAQNLKEICACLNATSDGRPLTSWQSAIPFSVNVRLSRAYTSWSLTVVQSVIFHKSSAKIRDQTPARRMIQDFAVAFQSRVSERKPRLQRRTNDADYGYFLLRLCKYKRTLEHYSQAYQQSGSTALPIEIKSVITEMLELLPILPAGQDALALTTVRGSVALPSTFTCCLPRLAGSNRVQAFRELSLPLSARQALENFGGQNQLAGLYKQILLRYRQDYPAFQNHDVLHAIGIFTCILTCYEHYNIGVHNHVLAQRQNEREEKKQHMSLMRGVSAHAPLSESVASLQRSTTTPPTSSQEPIVKVSDVSGSVPQQTIESSNGPYENLETNSQSWVAPILPPFSSKTFAGPFGRSEQQVLDRLLELESSGRLERGYSTMGRSFYRDAVFNADDATAVDEQNRLVAHRPLIVYRKSSSEDLFQSCLPSLDHVSKPASPNHIADSQEESRGVLTAQPEQESLRADMITQDPSGSTFGQKLWEIWSPTSCRAELRIVNRS